MTSLRIAARSGRLWPWALLLLVVVVVAGFLGWQWLRPRPVRTVADMPEVLHLNNQGVGYAEQFQWATAVEKFTDVVQRAPDWLPGRINLGIALLNANTEVPEGLERARELFSKILQTEPDNPYAHFCLGIIMRHEGKPEEIPAAAEHFRAVTRIDPNDPAAWYWYGNSLPAGSAEQNQCYERALQLDPYLSGAVYGLALNLRQQEPQRAEKLFQEFSRLRDADWLDGTQIKYTEMGHYAEVIGRVPHADQGARTGPLPLFARSDTFQVHLAPGVRWANAADFGNGPVAELRRQLRQRFGGVITVLDYNRDGKQDLFLVGAVVADGQVRDLLLRNDGNGHFTDVTTAAGLASPAVSLGCCVADYDNDGFPDLCLTGIGTQRLLRNTGQGKFEDVSVKAGLDQVKTVCLGAAFVDLDQDGDLDLVLAQYASLPQALALLKGEGAGGAGLAVFLNTGEAQPAAAGQSVVLSTRFTPQKEPAALLGEAVPAVGLVVGDLDADRDLDLLVLADRTPASLVLNDRLLRFHRQPIPEALVPRGTWNGGLVLDVDHDQRSDLFLIGPGQRPVLLLNRAVAAAHSPLTPPSPPDGGEGEKKAASPAAGRDSNTSSPSRPSAGEGGVRGGFWLQPAPTQSPPLLQAQAIDLDFDGWTDVVGLSEQHQPVLLHNRGGRLEQAAEALGAAAAWPKDLLGLVVADLDDDGLPDLLTWSEAAGLELHANKGNRHHGLRVVLSGQRRTDSGGNKLRCNADGLGTWVIAQAYDVWTAVENATLSAGLGQSHQPLYLGLGPHSEADVLRLRWPDNTWQAEFNRPTQKVVTIEETNRKTGSCPILFAWNGQRFGFITDFLGAGSMGEAQPDGSHRPPRPEESVKIEAEQLQPRDGAYQLKIAEPMDEVTYLDRLQLLVLDHPQEVRVYPDERFATDGSTPSQDLLAFREEIFPVRATDHRGRTVTETLRARDRQMVQDFAQRAWLGYAEEHWVELDFGDRLAKLGAEQPLLLCLVGWTEYAYPESIWAATQAGVALQPPRLERRGDDGQWHTIPVDVGFPAGLPRLMTVDVTGKLAGPRCVLRLRTNMEVYWDQIFIAPLLQRLPAAAAEAKDQAGPVRVTPLDVQAAQLAARGFLQEFSPDGRAPRIYDYERREAVPFAQLAGRLTRFGDVTELLQERDDRFVLFGPGDEVSVEFDARHLPPLPKGWTRSFVLRSWGYCKDCGPFTATGATIEPLPFRAMRNYPYGPDEHYPNDAFHEAYRKNFNTRAVNPAVGRR